MDENCPICRHANDDSMFRITLNDRRKGLNGVWRLVQCAGCHVIRLFPMPDENELAGFYAAYSRDESVELEARRGSRYPRLRKLFHRLSGDIDPRDFIDVSASSRVLDFGCGLGGYLSDFHDRGVAISGAEIASYVVEACRKAGYDVRQVHDFSRIPFADREFDIVYLMQVFEHLREPHDFLAELARVLKPGGELYLAVPNANSVWRKLFKSNWISGWFAPFHLYHYSRETLGKLAAGHGFEVVDCWSNTPESWFRLNLKACLYPQENQLDWRQTWIDSLPVRYVLMLLLRLVELPLAERDCLVARLKKQ